MRLPGTMDRPLSNLPGNLAPERLDERDARRGKNPNRSVYEPGEMKVLLE